jgi:hypothetical protein
LKQHARYLLFPKTHQAGVEPYQSFMPALRTDSTGSCEDYEELLLALAKKVSTVPDLQAGQEWTALVDGIARWALDKKAAGKTVNRLNKKFRHHSHAQFTMLESVAMGNLTAEADDFWSGGAGVQARVSELDPFANGFWYIKMHVAYPDPMFRYR